MVMKRKNWKSYLFWIGLSEAVGIIAGLLTRGGILEFQAGTAQPPFSPPGYLFPIVWTLLYALMGVGAARICLAEASGNRSGGLNLFVVQLAVNFLWPTFFFNFEWYLFSFFWIVLLWVLVFLMILRFYKIDKRAAYLNIPYLIWLLLAAYLNLGIWWLN